MKWDQESSALVNQAFARLGENDRVFSNIIAIRFEQPPEKFPVIVTGTSTCPGCHKEYQYKLEAYENFGACDRIVCSNPCCGDVYFVRGAYRPSRAEKNENMPIYVYSDLYTTLKGQHLSKVELEVSGLN